MRKLCLKLHRWLAIPFGVFMSILCFSGALLILAESIASMMGKDAHDMAFFNALFRLHRWLFMIPENPHGGLSVGRIITSLSAMAMTLVLLTGIVGWWPRNKAMLKSRLTVHCKKGFRRFVYDSHVSLGIYAVAFLLVMSLTGPAFSYGWYRNGVNTVIGQQGGPHSQNKGKALNMKEAPSAAKTASARPDRHHSSRPPQKGGSHGGINVKTLHTGTWLGGFSQLLYFLAALIGGCLPLSGYYLWWQRRKVKRD